MNKFSWQKLCFPLFGAQCAPLGMGKPKITCSFLSFCSAYRWRHIFTERNKTRYLKGHCGRLNQMCTNTVFWTQKQIQWVKWKFRNIDISIRKCPVGKNIWRDNRRYRKGFLPNFFCSSRTSAFCLWKAGIVNGHVLPIAARCDPQRSRLKEKSGEKGIASFGSLFRA